MIPKVCVTLQENLIGEVSIEVVVRRRHEMQAHREEFTQYIERKYQPLKFFAYRLTRDREDSQDLLQETLLKGYLYIDRFREGTNLQAWLYTIMRNIFINDYKYQQRRQHLQVAVDYHIDRRSCVENVAYASFLSNDLREAISSIDKCLSRPFLMYFNGYKYEEISRHLKLPMGTVKNRIHLARKKLRNILYLREVM